MSCNCGCYCGYCGGIDCYSKPCYSCGCNTTTSTTTTTTINPDCEPCDEFYDCECVIYNGDNIECYGLKTGDNLCDILQTIIENLPECKTTLPPFDCDFTAIATTSTSTTTSTTSTTTTTTTTTCTPQEFIMTATGGVTIVNIQSIISTGPFNINWGDGTINSFAAGNHIPSHTYTSPYSGPIKITSCDLSVITRIIDSNLQNGGFCGGKIEVPTTELAKLTGLDRLDMISMTVTGNVINLPRTITYLVVWGGNHAASSLPSNWCSASYLTPQGNTLSGNVGDLPPNVVNVNIIGLNTISGTVAQMPRSGALSTQGYRFKLEGNNTMSGDVADLPAIGTPSNNNSITIDGNNTITGVLADIPSTYNYINFGGGNDASHTPPGNTIGGDIADLSSNVKQLWMTGDNTITGDIANLPPTLIYLYVKGVSSIYGDIETMPCTSSILAIWFYDDTGTMSGITGSISNLGTLYPNLNSFTMEGSQTISGDISGLSNVLTTFRIACINAPITGTLSSLTSNTALKTFALASQLSTVDGDLADLPTSIGIFTLNQATAQVVTYSYPHTWGSTMTQCSVQGSPAFTTAEINNLLTDLNVVSNWITDANYARIVQLRGTVTVGPPDGTIAITGLQSKSVTVTITP